MDKKPYHEWLNFANRDLQSAVFLQNMYPIPFEIICYHCQQSAEKFLKAYLILNDVKVKRTHDLVVLQEDCCRLNSDFKTIENECINLTDYSVTTRYPYPMELNEHDMKMAIKDVQHIKEFVEFIIESKEKV